MLGSSLSADHKIRVLLQGEHTEIFARIGEVYRKSGFWRKGLSNAARWLLLRTNRKSYMRFRLVTQESPAIADKPARRESLPKIAPIRRAYNVVADNTGLSSFV